MPFNKETTSNEVAKKQSCLPIANIKLSLQKKYIYKLPLGQGSKGENTGHIMIIIIENGGVMVIVAGTWTRRHEFKSWT